MQLLAPLLPEKHAPLQKNGDGNRFYLVNCPERLANALLGLIGHEGEARRQDCLSTDRLREDAAIYQADKTELVDTWYKAIEKDIDDDPNLKATEKTETKKARIGQGIFKRNVTRIEKFCRVTRVENIDHLIGSHIKPWSNSTNRERLDGENGLLLTPSIDHLFDGGFISFKNNGDLIVSSVSDGPSLQKMGIPQGGSFNAGSFTKKQTDYLEYHRDLILLRSRSKTK